MYLSFRRVLFFIGLLTLSVTSYAATITPNREATQRARHAHQKTTHTLLCHVPIQENRLRLTNADLLPKAATQLRYHFLVPPARFGQALSCWQIPCLASGKTALGHHCCQQSLEYAAFVQDGHLIAPLIPKAARALQEYTLDTISIPDEIWAGCGVRIRYADHRLEPPDSAKGAIARAYLYAYARYQYPLSVRELELFLSWHQTFPPTEWEKTWDNEVFLQQGTHNPYITP